MSLYGIMRTGVSGMNAQANRLSSVAENVANVNTTGYKRSSTEFSTLLLSHCPGDYESGAVNTVIRNHVSAQGSLLNTTSVTDLAIGGRGFLLVSDKQGQPFLTRAGSFVPDENGNLVNAAGFRLMGYRLDPDQPGVTVNGFTNLEAINLESLSLTASASTAGTFVANLPADAQIIPAANLPSTNAPGIQFTAKSSLISHDSLGREIVLDLYYSKTADNSWELAVYNQQDAGSSGGFPYGAAPLATMQLTFDPSTGNLDAGSATAIDIPVPGGVTLELDLSRTSQLATDYVVLSAKVNGNAPGGAELIDIARDGTVYATYENGTRIPVFRIPLANVMSPDMLTPLAGNVYLPSPDSGDIQVGFAQTGGLGDVISGALEQSTVDLASELTAMIDAQRSYSANSKVFQTGSELMDVLVNLKR
jgi:flagellar hook protein FlgE